MPITPTQAALVVTILVALGFVWYYEGRGRWRSLVADRFVAGVPWGTALTVSVVVAFYLSVQAGPGHWDEPLVLPFVTWSYFYPTGLLTAGIAHASPGHLVSNVTATLALAPIAEYAWGHYPPSRRSADGTAASVAVDATGSRGRGGWLERPWIRALVVFPVVVLAAAFVSAVFSLGPGLGFSGALFAVAGFAVVTYPLSTVVAVVASSGLGTLYGALSRPVVRETIDPGAPGPPDWAGIGFQAHVLGFLLGVVVAVAVVRRRGRWQSTERVFFATGLLGLVLGLWLLTWSEEGEVFYLYRGAGVVFVLLLTLVVTLATAGSDRALPGLRSVFDGSPSFPVEGGPTGRQLAIAWLVLVGVGLLAGGIVAATRAERAVAAIGPLLLLAVLLALPALPALVPDRFRPGPVTRRGAAAGVLAVLTVLVALWSVPLGLLVVGEEAVPGSGAVEVGDYAVTYEENATSGHVPAVAVGDPERFATEQSGLIVVSDDREIWTVAAHERVVAHDGNATVHVGGIGWRTAVEANRTGWEVVGNGSAYVVDLTVEGETTRSFESAPVRANARIEGHAIDLVPADDGFRIRLRRDGSTVAEAPIPDVGETTAIGDLRLSTEEVDDAVRVFAESDGATVQVAEREEYPRPVRVGGRS